MPRQRPTKRLDVLGPLELGPRQALEAYFVSVLQNRLFLKPPSGKANEDTIESLSIENERELQASLYQQTLLQQHSKRQNVINKLHIEDLYKLQEELRQRFIEANTFIKDCDDKRKQAQQAITMEKTSQDELKKFIRETKENVDSLLQFRGHLLKTVGDLEPYETVMHEAIGKFKIWTSIKDCTDRCDALMITQAQLDQDRKEAASKIEDIRLKFIKISQEAAAEVLALDTTLTGLERDTRNMAAETLEWERELVKIKDALIAEELKGVLLMEKIFTMYCMLSKRRGLRPTLKKTDIERQITFIWNEIKILKKVAKICLNEEKL